MGTDGAKWGDRSIHDTFSYGADTAAAEPPGPTAAIGKIRHFMEGLGASLDPSKPQ